MSKKILCILGSKHFYGKERSNIEVYNLLKDQANTSIKIVMNEEASDELKRYLQSFNTIATKFPNRNHQKFKYLKYLSVGLRLNFKMVLTIIRFRPDFIFLNDERIFYDVSIPIYMSSGRVVYRIGDQPAYPKLSNYKLNSWIWKNIVLKKTETFVYISEFIKNTVEVTGRNTTNDAVIYNYPPRRKKATENFSKKYRKTNAISIGYLGQIIEDKGVHLFVEAAIKLLKEKKDLIFYLAGDLKYSQSFANKLLQSVSEHKFDDHIVFLDNIDDVETFFNNIDILVTPSMKEEPLGNVIVEAKKYETTSIIFKSGGMPELIDHKNNGFICEDRTATNIEEAIEYYLANPELIALHGQNAKKSIELLKIDYAHFTQKWLRVFDY